MNRRFRSILPIAIAILLLTLLWMLFFWRLLTPNAVDRVIFPEGDFTQHYFAFSDYQMDRLAAGEFPLWNPYNHAGDPFASNIQFVAFYPPRLLAALIAADDWSLEAYQLEVAAHYWLASVMMFAFVYVLANTAAVGEGLRPTPTTNIDMNTPALGTWQVTPRQNPILTRTAIALAGSILYTYSGYLTGYPMLQVSVLESVIWLPLMMLGVHLSVAGGTIRWLVWGCIIAGIGMALSLLGGHPQTTMHLTYAALAYLAFLTVQRWSVRAQWASSTTEHFGNNFASTPQPPASSPLRREGEQRQSRQLFKSPLQALGRGFRGGVRKNRHAAGDTASLSGMPLRDFVLSFVIRAALFGGIGVGLSMIQLPPAAEFTRLSYRVTQLGFEDKANGFLAGDFLQVIWARLFGVWSPLYVGVGGFLLALGAMLRPRAEHRFWMGVIIVALFLSMGGGTIVFDLFYNIVPGFGMFRQQERAAAVLVFGLVVLAVRQLQWIVGYGGAGASWQDVPTDNMEFVETQHAVSLPMHNADDDDRAHRVYGWLVAGYAVVLLAAAILAGVVELLQGATTNANPTGDVFMFTAVVGGLFAVWYRWTQGTQARHTSPLHVSALLLLLVVDLFTVGTRSENYLPDVPENRVHLLPELEALQVAPEDIRWRVDGAASLQGNGVLFRVPDIYGTGPFSLATIEELRQIPVDRFWEVLSVRYATTLDEPPDGVPLELLAYGANYTGQEFKLFELTDPRPMAHLVYDYRDASGDPVFARQIMSDSRVNLREMAIALHPLPFELPGERPEMSRVDDFRFVTPEHAEMTVSTEDNALLTVSIVNYPGWHAYVNDEAVDIVDVYAGLIGVPIRAGENQPVRLEFAPDSVRWGGIVTGLTALFAVVLAVGVLFVGRKRSA